MARKKQKESKRAQQQQAVVDSLQDGASRLAACEAASLPRRTFYDWLKAEPAFRARVEEAECQSIRTMESVVYAAGLKSEEDPRYLRAALAWLMNKGGWSAKGKLELTGPGDGPVEVVQIYLPHNGREGSAPTLPSPEEEAGEPA